MSNEEMFMEKHNQSQEPDEDTKEITDLLSSLGPGLAPDLLSSLIDAALDDESGSETEEVDVDVINIGGTDYIIMDVFQVQESTYYCLISKRDSSDIIYRKLLIKDGEPYLTKLASGEEFQKVLSYQSKRFLQGKKEEKNPSTDTIS